MGDADVGQFAAEGHAGRARADPQRLVGGRRAAEGVGFDVELGRLTVDVELHAGRLARTVVGDGDVRPRVAREEGLRLHLDRVGGPGVDEVEGELPSLGDGDVVAAEAGRVVHLADACAVGERPDPEGDGERLVVLQVRAGAGFDERVVLAVERQGAAGRAFGPGRLALAAVRGPGGQGPSQLVAETPFGRLARQIAGPDRRFPLRLPGAQARFGLLDRLRGLGDRGVEAGERRPVGVARDGDQGRDVAAGLGVDALLVDVVEEAEERIEFLLADRVVLVVVAAGASHRQAEEDGGRGLDAVDGVLDPPFLLDRPGLGDGAVVAVEAGGDLLGQGGVGEPVAGDLFDREAVEGHVAVERRHDPVAPGPHGPGEVVLIAVGVGVAGAVEPVAGHRLAVPRGGEQAVDQPLVGVRGVIGQEGVDLGEGRGDAEEVQRQAADQGRLVGLGGGLQALALQPGQDEAVDRVPGAVGEADGRRLGTLRGFEGPVLAPRRPLVDPAGEGRHLLGRERLAGLRRRHLLLGVVGDEPSDQLAVVGLAGLDDRVLGPERPLADVEPEVGLAGAGVRPVAEEAVFGEDGEDVAAEVDGGLGPEGGRRQGRDQPQRDDNSVRHAGRRSSAGSRSS